MATFAEKVINFNKTVDFKGDLPDGIRVMNPFKENQNTLDVSSEFYRRYYSDNNSRHLVLGINPGRFGAGLTGIPFTDSVRLNENCHIDTYAGSHTYELSSVFVYDMIKAFGGEEKFYGKFYINSMSPLGFTTIGKKGNEINCNYYDTKDLMDSTRSFIIDNIQKQIEIGCNTDICFCLGTGKNQQFLTKINKEYKFFNEIIILEHPRYIMQYKLKSKQVYIDKYITAFHTVVEDAIGDYRKDIYER